MRSAPPKRQRTTGRHFAATRSAPARSRRVHHRWPAASNGPSPARRRYSIRLPQSSATGSTPPRRKLGSFQVAARSIASMRTRVGSFGKVSPTDIARRFHRLPSRENISSPAKACTRRATGGSSVSTSRVGAQCSGVLPRAAMSNPRQPSRMVARTSALGTTATIASNSNPTRRESR